MHGRIASRLAAIAGRFDVRLYIVGETEQVDCSSVLDVMSMAFVHGTRLLLRACGKDAAQAVAAAEEVLAGGGMEEK
ncbi:MAG: hypothetical protein Kow0089_04770 [Desulfobulbaceae bacterium]